MLIATKTGVFFEDLDSKKMALKYLDKGEVLMLVSANNLLPAAKESIRDRRSNSPKVYFIFLWGELRLATVASSDAFHRLFYVMSEKDNE